MATLCPNADGSSPQQREFDEAPPMCIDPEKTYTATMVTSMGTMVIHLNAAQEPKTVNNSVGNSVRDTRMVNLLLPAIDTSQETIDRTVQCSYKMDHFCSGQKGVAMFAIDHLLKDTRGQLGYVCTDPSRGVFKHLDDEGEVVRDLGAAKLTSKLAKPIRSKAGILAKELTGEGEEMFAVAIKNLRDIANISENNSGFRTALANGTVQ